MVDTFKKKNYDILDHRKQDFDNDYVDFRTQIDSLQLSLQGFMDSWFTKNLSVSDNDFCTMHVHLHLPFILCLVS